MKKLLAMNAPHPIISGEADLILRAHLKAEGDIALVLRLAWTLAVERVRIQVFSLRVDWFKFRGMTEDEAIEAVSRRKR